MVRLKDVAMRCGVSTATVSKALSDKSDIGKETKERIRRVCEEMGYLPNASAGMLRSHRSYNLGIVHREQDRTGLRHAYFSPIIDSFRDYAENHGYDVTFIGNGKSGTMSYLERARYRGVDGLLLAGASYARPGIEELIESDIPVVLIDHSDSKHTCINSDNARGMRDLIGFIHERGHRRIAFIYGDDTPVTRTRVDSFYKSLQKKEIIPPDQYVRSGAFRHPKLAHEITMELLDLHPRPTCIIYPDDYSALGGVDAIKERGFRIPEDISVAGYDGIYITQILEPRLTTIRQNTNRIGEIAAAKLIDQIERPDQTGIETIMVRGDLLEGGSVGIISK